MVTISGKNLAAAALGLLIAVSFTAPASAAPRRAVVVDRGWNAHEARSYHDWHRPHYVPAPRVVYSPPVVYAPPPPPEPAGINLILPLNFR